MTKKEIKAEIARLQQKLQTLMWRNDSECLELYQKWRHAVDRYDESVSKEYRAVCDRLLFLEKSLKKPKLETHPLVEKLIRALCRGVDWSGNFSQVWISEDCSYCVLKKSGGTCWAGIGLPRKYVPAEYFLMKLCETDESGITLMKNACVEKVEGRLPKDTLIQWQLPRK